MVEIDPKVWPFVEELDRLRTRDDAWQIPLEEGRLLYNLAVSTGARLVVEIGSSYGFSGLFWGMAMKRVDGHLHTIDVSPKKYDSAKLTFAQAGLNGNITNHLGDARQIVPTLAGEIDIAFLDADKSQTMAYLETVWGKLRVGGSVLTDNATTHRNELAAFVKHVRGRADANSVELPVGNGLEWTLKTA